MFKLFNKKEKEFANRNILYSQGEKKEFKIYHNYYNEPLMINVYIKNCRKNRYWISFDSEWIYITFLEPFTGRYIVYWE